MVSDAGAVVELGLQGRDATARPQRDGAQRAAQPHHLAVGRVRDRRTVLDLVAAP